MKIGKTIDASFLPTVFGVVEQTAENCHSVYMTNSDAYVLRDATGTTGVAQTTKTVAETLAHWDIPHLVTIEKLISLKLDSWSASKASRLRDKADVVELVIRRNLPRELALMNQSRTSTLPLGTN